MPSVLLIGLGRWGQEHLRVWRALDVEVFACDLRDECLEQAAAVLPRDHLTHDAEAFLSRVDAVDIVTPVQEHFELCRQAIDAGKDVLVEKPMTATLKEARDLYERVRLHGARLQVGHIFRFHPVYQAIKTALAAGRLGRLRYLGGRFAGLKRPRVDGGVTQSDVIHFVDLFADLLGRPRGVSATVRDFLGRGMDDFAIAVVEFERELAVVESSYFPAGTWRELQVVGEHGVAVADFANWKVTFHDGHHRYVAGQWQVEAGPSVVHAVKPDEPLRRELHAFMRGIGTGEPPMVDAEVGYRALVLVEAIHVAAGLGRRVSIEEVES
jgi:UDP-N-acetylglucosamine 3-dehydrogenase